MKIAITEWRGRIAPLFDVAQHLLICESEGYGKPLKIIKSLYFETPNIDQKISILKEEDIDTIICGAISSEYETLLLDSGFEIYGFVAADYEEVITAWGNGELAAQRRFGMPGCHWPRHRRRRDGQGYGRGFGRAGRGRGRFYRNTQFFEE